MEKGIKVRGYRFFLDKRRKEREQLSDSGEKEQNKLTRGKEQEKCEEKVGTKKNKMESGKVMYLRKKKF